MLHVPERDDSTDVSLGGLLDRVEALLEKNVSHLSKMIFEAALGVSKLVKLLLYIKKLNSIHTETNLF